MGPRVLQLQSLIRRDPVFRWTVAASAKALHVSPRTLQRSLREDNATFSATLTETRVELARTLLNAGELSLTEIAFCSGFSDLGHFSRAFKQRFDVPPSAYRSLR